MKHKHHIVPKHMGGTDEPENIAFLTPEEHAKAHKDLYEEHGKIEDYLAWRGLAGFMGKEEIIEKMMEENGRRNGNNSYKRKQGIHNPDFRKSEKYKKICSENGKIQGRRMAESGHCKRVAPLGGGKNLGKNFWFNPETGEETQSFSSPGEVWIKGRNSERINVESLRKNSDNVKGTFWVTNKETRETRMIFPHEEIPEGFSKGRVFSKKNLIDLHNTSDKVLIEGIPQVKIEYSSIIFNPGNSRWEFHPKKSGRRITKISHTDYYGIVWARDCFSDIFEMDLEKSKFNFSEKSLDKILEILKDWREFQRNQSISSSKNIKKYRKKFYLERLEKSRKNYEFLESIRNQMIQNHQI